MLKEAKNKPLKIYVIGFYPDKIPDLWITYRFEFKSQTRFSLFLNQTRSYAGKRKKSITYEKMFLDHFKFWYKNHPHTPRSFEKFFNMKYTEVMSTNNKPHADFLVLTNQSLLYDI